MIEIFIKNKLEEMMNTPIFLKYPDENIDEFIIIEKIGSSKNNHLKDSTFVFQSYSNNIYNTMKLNEQLKESVENLLKFDEIASVKLNSDYNFTDTERKKHRYQAIFDINHY